MRSSSRAENSNAGEASLGARLWATLAAVWWLCRTGVLLVRFMLGSLRLAAYSVVDVRRLSRQRTQSGALPLRQHSPGVLEAVRAPTAAGALTVICFTGTGEAPEALYAALHTLTSSVESLARAPHYVVEAPASPGAYQDARAFANATWEALAPCVARHAGPFVLIGMSRGGLVAMEAGMRIASEQRKVASVLALSAPLHVPARLPQVVSTLAAVEPMLSRALDAINRAWAPAARLMGAIVRTRYLGIASMILRDMRMTDPRNLAFVRDDIASRGLAPCALRSTREFRLLEQIVPREAELFAADVASTAAHNPLFFASWQWGADDRWLSAQDSRAQLERALSREPGAALHVQLGTVEGQGHGLFREERAADQATRAQLGRVVREAAARHAQEAERRARAAEREQRMQSRAKEQG